MTSHIVPGQDQAQRNSGLQPGQSPAVTLMLVSKELMPQYLGFVHTFTPHVLLVVTDSMQERAAALEGLLRSAPRPPQHIDRTPFADSEGFAALCRRAEAVLQQLLRHSPEAVIVNLTGGTKLMSMAFHDAARALQRQGHALRTEYVDTANARIESLDLAPAPARPMHCALDVKAAVLASGKEAAGCGSASPLFRRYMQRTTLHAKLLDLTGQELGLLNMLSAAAVSGNRGQSFSLDTATPGSDLVQTIRQGKLDSNAYLHLGEILLGPLGVELVRHGVLREPPRGKPGGELQLAWRTSAEIAYLNGGWLEAHVAACIEAAGPDDWASDVQIGKEIGRNNEIDTIVTCGNRTLLIEVKTAALGRQTSADDGSKSTKGQDTLYKLDSVGHELARNFNDNWLVSARPLSEPDRERARDKRIRLFAPQGKERAKVALQEFQQTILDWVHTARRPGMTRLQSAFRQLSISSQWRQKEGEEKTSAPPPAQANGAASSAASAPITALSAAFAKARNACAPKAAPPSKSSTP